MYKVVPFLDDIYDVLRITEDGDAILCYQGGVADCLAWIELRGLGMI